MSIVDVGMTNEQATAALRAVPVGKYVAQFVRLLENDQPGANKYLFATKKEGAMMKPLFQLEKPEFAGKTMIGMAVLGQFSFAELVVALPNLYVPGTTQIDSDQAKGTRVVLDVGQQVKLKAEYVKAGGQQYVDYSPELEEKFDGPVMNKITHILPYVEGVPLGPEGEE